MKGVATGDSETGFPAWGSAYPRGGRPHWWQTLRLKRSAVSPRPQVLPDPWACARPRLPHVGSSSAEHADSRSPGGDRSARCPGGQHPHPPLLGVRSRWFCYQEVRSSFCFRLRSSFRSPPAGSSGCNEPFLLPSPPLPSACYLAKLYLCFLRVCVKF